MDTYDVEILEADISMNEFLNKYVDVDTFIEYCRACPNHNMTYACPEYDFDIVNDFWRHFDSLHIYAEKITFPNISDKDFEEQKRIMTEAMLYERESLAERLGKLEEENPGSRRLSAGGGCTLCKVCARLSDEPCRFPEKVRYSIEALGGNVVKLMEDELHTPLAWSKDGKVQEYMMLIAGICMKDTGHEAA